MMKKIATVGLLLLLAGCGANKKALRQADELLEKSKTADCQTIREYLGLIQAEVRKQLQ